MPRKARKTRKKYSISCSISLMERLKLLSENADIPMSRLQDEAVMMLLAEYAKKGGIHTMQDNEKRKTKYVIALANHKGGVGKTTTTTELACLFARDGKRVLLLDADAQINLTQMMRVQPDGKIDIQGAIFSRCAYVMNPDPNNPPIPIDTFIVPTQYANVDMIPGSLLVESNNFNNTIQQVRLQQGINPWSLVVDEIKFMNYYDVILMDTHPSIGMDTLLPLQACNEIIVPLEPAASAVSGLLQVYQNILKSRMANPQIHFLGCFFNRVKLNASSTKEYIPSIREQIPEIIKKNNHGQAEGQVFTSMIRDSEDARKSGNFHSAITEKYRNSKIAGDFVNLYHEILEALERE